GRGARIVATLAAEETGTLTVDAADGTVTADLAAAARWHALVLNAGRPVARVELASPGRLSGNALASAAILRWADWEATRDALVERLRERMGLQEEPAQERAGVVDCSVIVCTHRRPGDLRRLLAGLARLDPAPREVVVVDNDPGGQDCEAAARAAGARYVREDRRGLDNARNAGVATARAPVVAFIDDDCVPSPGWLRRLPVELANPAVVGVTGPAFPYALDTPARRRMERQASLARGLRRVEFDWLTCPIAGAGAIGVGANMAYRRDALLELGPQPFPPELDAGTLTESGGDTYVMAKLLARGHRLVYDPATFVYHRHRGDGRALHRAVFGYGVGLGAALAKLTLEDRELSAPATAIWLLTQYRKTQQRRLAGFADAVETRLAWDYVRGGLHGPLRWSRARRAVPWSPPPAPSAPAAPATSAAAARASDGAPRLSVVVPTHERPQALARCLQALAGQDADAPFEVVVADDARAAPATVEPALAQRLRLRHVRTGGRGAAAARNAGAAAASAPLLLFLDDDVVASPGLVRAHLERHAREGERAVVVGPYAPAPERRTLAASAAALWWHDLFHALARNRAQTYLGALTGNMSLVAEDFARSGGFDERFGTTRREDWEWGLRALRAGLALRFEPGASARHAFALDAAGRLRAAEGEGAGDVLLLGAHPQAGSALLPLAAGALEAGGRTRRLQQAAWGADPFRRAALAALAALERARLRRLWVRAFNAAQRLSYVRGVRAAAPQPPAATVAVLDVDLDARAPVPPPALVPPTVRVRVGGEVVAQVEPALGQWTPALAEQLVDAVPWQLVDVAAAACGARPARDERHDHLRRTLVVPICREAPLTPGARERLGAAGAQIADGDAGVRWSVLVDRGAASERELIAFVLPGVRADARWLEQALVAFDGERVGAVLGCGLPDGAPPAPLVLHARGATTADLRLDAVAAPWYLAVRRELLASLGAHVPGGDLLTQLLAFVERLLGSGAVVAYRDVHGLAGAGPGAFAGARALASARTLEARGPAASAELRRATLTAAWHLVRRQERRPALAAYAGAVSGVLTAGRQRRSPTA
ncbi:MAG TPA: glycosyltransferase, partial [Conexibacter sp.]|nr:glycosyltransferase [Conexibacter sp.]